MNDDAQAHVAVWEFRNVRSCRESNGEHHISMDACATFLKSWYSCSYDKIAMDDRIQCNAMLMLWGHGSLHIGDETGGLYYNDAQMHTYVVAEVSHGFLTKGFPNSQIPGRFPAGFHMGLTSVVPKLVKSLT